MKILVDMNLSPQWISFLQQHSFDAIHWSDVGSASASDLVILEYARARNFVVFTRDLDFGMLLAMQQTRGPSIVQIRTLDALPATVGRTVVNALNDSLPYLRLGALVSVDAVGHRIRLLPISTEARF